ncbi:Hydrolase 4 domain-containing protein [Citrus sinensis]|nr:Hydrolase 4 domain-containing protein [Citrus sinensis]
MATTTATLYHQLPSDIRLATCTLFRSFNHRHLLIPQWAGALRCPHFSRSTTPFRLLAFSTNANEPFVEKVSDKPPICSADELHYVSVANCDWRLALWRYNPPPQAPTRNHPLLLLSGVGTNAIGYDLSPGSSFARYMAGQGFDTWILEVRGAGLNSKISPVKKEDDLTRLATVWDESKLVTKLTETFMSLSERLSGFLSQLSVSPQLFDLQERLFSTIDDFQKQLDLIVRYDWDFDHYLEEDVPAAMEYIRAQSKPKDGKLLAIGHSMGGILLYAMLSRCGFEGRESRLAAIVTLASSLDYTSSKSTLKLLLPLADPAQALNVPVVPLGALLTAAYPLSSSPPYVFSWLNNLISAEDMMHPELLKKLVLNNFCTIPAKLILQLTTAFREGGLRDRGGKFFYKDHIHKCNIPILAIAGDQDLICPPEAVEETVKLLPEDLVTYKVFGEPSGPHYAHYDLVGGRMAVEQVYPCIVQFLGRYDSVS